MNCIFTVLPTIETLKFLFQGRLPLRWMAYESVFNGISTSQSDVYVIGFCCYITIHIEIDE